MALNYITDNTYAIKYYWESYNQKGELIRLNIRAKGYKGAPIVYRICDLVSLKFQVQGDTSALDSPIIKTLLQITLVDSYDAEDKEIGYEYIEGARKYVYEKHGAWEEFFTPDSTKYLVEVVMTPNPDSQYNETRTIWRGYVTPDSWHESLSYRGSITIVARDNLGHLSDFDFDLTPDDWGLVKVYDIIEGAMTKINFPMRLYYQTSENDFRPALVCPDADTSSDLGLVDLRVNASAFEGMTWWEALEETLNSIGCVLRFTDYQSFNVMPLRLLPDMGWAEEEWKTLAPDMEFYGGSRMLDPAYKEIVEKIDFGQQDKQEFQMADVPAPTYSEEQNDTFVLEFKNDHVVNPYGGQESRSSSVQYSAPARANTSGGGDIGNLSFLHGSIDPTKYDIQDYTKETEGEGFRNYLFIAANLGTMSYSSGKINISYSDAFNFSFLARVKSSKFKLKLDFASPAGFDDNGKLGSYPFKLWKLKYRISYGTTFGGGTKRYWTGDNWVEASGNGYIIEKTFDPETEDITSIEESLIPCDAVGEYGYMWITIVSMVYRTITYWWTYNGGLIFNVQVSKGVYARLKSISLESELTKKMVSDTVKTVNNEQYNVRCTRNPRFGCLSQSVGFVYPSNYRNAFFYLDSNGFPQAAPYLWKWTDRSTKLGFPVQVALQILQYHATPLEVLEGATGMVDKINRITFDDSYVYKGLAHLLLSGNYDLMTARFDSAILRAYARFSNVSTRSAVQAADSGEAGEAETPTGDVRALKISDAKLALLDRVQTAEVAETVETETELQEETPAKVYEVPAISAGTRLEITDGMEVERAFVTREIASEELNP